MNRLQALIAAGALSALAGGAGLLLLADEPCAPLSAAADGSPRLADGRPQVTLRPASARTAAALSPALLAQATSAAAGAHAPGDYAGGVAGTRVSQARGAARRPAARADREQAAAAGAPVAGGERIQTRIHGRVVDERGYPLTGVQVASLGPAGRAVTDADGAFELLLDRAAGPQHAGLVVQARAAGFETADRVLVSQEPELELELELVRRVEEAALSVCVLDAYGQRVPRERVFVTPEGAVDTFSSPTLDDGTCRLSALSPGPVLVWLRESPDSAPSLQQRIELLPGENQLDLRLP